MITELLFKKRLIAFYSSWRTHKHLWGHSDIILVSTTTSSSSSSSSSRDFFLWLLEEDLAGTTAVFTPSSIFFLCRHERLYGLRSLGRYAMRVMNIPVSVELIKPNDEEEWVSKLDEIIRCRRYKLYGAGLICTLSVGCIEEEEIPKWKLLLSCFNGYDYFTRFRIAGVNRGLRKLIVHMPLQCYNNKLELDEEEEKEFKRQLRLQLKKEKNGVIKEKILSVPEQRLRLLYSSWRKYRKELWGNSDVLVVTSSSSMHHHHPVSCSFFFLWLLGSEFPNTTAVFMDQALHIFCTDESRAKLSMLGVYLTSKEVPFFMKVKGVDGDESELLNSTLYAAAAAAAPHPVTIGYIDGEAPNSMVTIANERMFQTTNVISGFVNLLNNEEEGEGLKSHQTPPQSYNKDIADENYEQQQQQQVMSLSSSSSNDAKEGSSMVSNEQQKDDEEVLHEENKNEQQQLLLLHKSEEEGAKKLQLPSKFAEMNINNNVVEEDGSESSSKLLLLVASEEEEDNASKESDDDWEIIQRANEGQEEEEEDIANNSMQQLGRWIGRRTFS